MPKQKFQIILIIQHYCAKPEKVLWYIEGTLICRVVITKKKRVLMKI